MEWDARIGVLIGLIALVLAVAALFFGPTVQPISDADARNVMLDDVRSSFGDACVRSATVARAGQRWQGSVQFTVNPGTACPILVSRAYEFLPIAFREERLVRDCQTGGRVVFDDEAVIRSSRAPAVQALGPDARACVSRVPYAAPACCALDVTGLNAFAQNQPLAAWVAVWSDGQQRAFIALDEFGNVLGQHAGA